MSDASNASPRLIRVWDPGVRIFHWLLVIAVALTFLSSEEEGAFSAWHIPIGWACALLIVFRLVWGIVGAFLAAPLTVMIMIVLAQFPSTRWIAILLSADGKPVPHSSRLDKSESGSN